MRVLVTGCDGFIGSHLKVDAIGIDLKRGDDVLTSYDVIREFDPQVVYHLAAHHFIPWCEDHPWETTRTNVLGTEAVLEACGPSLETFVLASSAAVYGFSSARLPEDSALVGTGVYAASKQEAERRLARFGELRPGVRSVAARLFNVVGPGDSWPHVLPSIAKAHMAGEPVYVGNTWPQRDYVHVDDVTDALQLLAERAPLGFSAWNVGTGDGTSVGELLQVIGLVSGRKVDAHTRYEKTRADDGHLIADVLRTAELGWVASRSLLLAIGEVLGANTVQVG